MTHTLDVKQHEMEAKAKMLGGHMETMAKQGLGNQMEGSPKKLDEVYLILYFLLFTSQNFRIFRFIFFIHHSVRV